MIFSTTYCLYTLTCSKNVVHTEPQKTVVTRKETNSENTRVRYEMEPGIKLIKRMHTPEFI